MLWLPLSLLVLSALAHASRLQPRIMGGRTASKGEYPFVVYMHNGAEKTFCGGSIIGQQWILTAAHCIKTAKANDITVYVGQYNYNLDPSKATQVAKVVVHPQYNDNSMVNDIAMLQLSTNITWSDSVQPIDIDTASIGDGIQVTALGWGFTSPTGKSASKDLKEGPLTTQSVAQCGKKDTQFNGNNGKRICVAGDTGTDTCPGDSGGPLIRQVNGKNMLLGITSFGTAGPGASITVNCGGAGMVSLFTHANAFLSYIQTTTRSIDSSGKVIGFDESQFNSSGTGTTYNSYTTSGGSSNGASRVSSGTAAASATGKSIVTGTDISTAVSAGPTTVTRSSSTPVGMPLENMIVYNVTRGSGCQQWDMGGCGQYARDYCRQ